MHIHLEKEIFELKSMLNPWVLVRIAGSDVKQLESIFFENGIWINKVEQLLLLKKYLLNERDELTSIIYEKIKVQNKDQKIYLNLKRDIYNQRHERINLNKLPESMDVFLKKRILNWIESSKTYVANYENLKVNIDEEKELLGKQYSEIWKKDFPFRDGVKFASKTLSHELDKYSDYGQLPLKLSLSFLKYYSRATLKTSPFGKFCIVGVGYLNLENKDGAIQHKQPKSFYINGKLDGIKNEEKNGLKNFENKSYYVNKNIWFYENKAFLLVRSPDIFSAFLYRNGEQLLTIDLERKLKNLITYLSNLEDFTYKEFNQYLDKYFDDESMAADFESLIEHQIFLPTNITKLEASLPLVSEFAFKEKSYEDYLIEQPVKVNINAKLTKSLEQYHKLLYLVDEQRFKMESFAKHIYHKYGVKELKFDEILVNYIDFEKKSSNHSYSKNKLKLYQLIEKQINQTFISLDNIDNLFGENIISKPYGMTYYLQVTKDGEAFVNNIQSGYGRAFTRYNYKEVFQGAASYYTSELSGNYEAIEIIHNRGYTANYHNPVTDHFIDYAGLYNSSKNAINLNELTFKYCEETQQLNIQRVGSSNKVQLLHLHQASPSYGGKAFQLLVNLNQSESINLDLANYFNKIIKGNVLRIPPVKINDLIVSREKWILNKEALEEFKMLEIQDLILRLYEFHNYNELPTIFYVRRLSGDKAFSYRKIDDFYKPQFISFKNIHSIILYQKIIQQSNGNLVIEKCEPFINDLLNINERKRVVEIGVEVYAGL